MCASKERGEESPQFEKGALQVGGGCPAGRCMHHASSAGRRGRSAHVWEGRWRAAAGGATISWANEMAGRLRLLGGWAGVGERGGQRLCATNLHHAHWPCITVADSAGRAQAGRRAGHCWECTLCRSNAGRHQQAPAAALLARAVLPATAKPANDHHRRPRPTPASTHTQGAPVLA